MRLTHFSVQKLSALGAVALLVVGCSDSATGPDGSGNGFAQAVVTDDPNSTTPGASPAFRIAGNSESAAYTGTISGNMSVAISADGNVWYDLGSPNGIAVLAQHTSGGTNVHGEVAVPAGTWARVRLVIANGEATIHSGAVIDGITLTTDVNVTLGSGGQIVIEREIETFPVTADATVRTEILFDLNSELWVTKDNVDQGQASEEEVESAGRAETRTRSRDNVQ